MMMLAESPQACPKHHLDAGLAGLGRRVVLEGDRDERGASGRDTLIVSTMPIVLYYVVHVRRTHACS